MSTSRCVHEMLQVVREKDRCYYVRCLACGKASAAKSGYAYAVMAWILQRINQHPRV